MSDLLNAAVCGCFYKIMSGSRLLSGGFSTRRHRMCDDCDFPVDLSGHGAVICVISPDLLRKVLGCCDVWTHEQKMSTACVLTGAFTSQAGLICEKRNRE